MVEVNPSCIVPSLCVKAAEMIKPESHLEVRHRDVGDKYAGKGLLQIHLWCSDDLQRLWDRIE